MFRLFTTGRGLPRPPVVVYSGGRIEIVRARGFFSRLMGQLVGPPRPLLLVRCRAVHGFGMRRALDLWFVDGDYRLVATVVLRPWRWAFRRRARHVFELPAGRYPAPVPGECLEPRA